jgi:hypothetical protein
MPHVDQPRKSSALHDWPRIAATADIQLENAIFRAVPEIMFTVIGDALRKILIDASVIRTVGAHNPRMLRECEADYVKRTWAIAIIEMILPRPA